MGSSTGNMLVDEETVLEQIFRHAPTTIATHCEDTPTILANEEAAKKKYHNDAPFWEHPNIRSREACLKSSTLATELAKRGKCPPSCAPYFHQGGTRTLYPRQYPNHCRGMRAPLMV